MSFNICFRCNFDEDDEALEDLDDVTEDGFLLGQSDINTSDLYRIQNRIFQSETETDDEETTDQVRQAMKQINDRQSSRKRNPIYDTEDRQILGMNSRDVDFEISDSEKYLRRPVNRNAKYN